MFLDQKLVFSDGQAITSTAISTKVIEIAKAPNLNRDIGVGEPLWVMVTTKAALTDVGNDATLTVSLEVGIDATLASSQVLAQSAIRPFATINLPGSLIWVTQIPPRLFTNDRAHMGLRYTVAAGPFTGGSINAFMTKDIQRFLAYQSNSPIHPNA